VRHHFLKTRIAAHLIKRWINSQFVPVNSRGYLQRVGQNRDREIRFADLEIRSSELFQQERGEATLFIPVEGGVRTIGRVTPVTVPAAELAVINHRGSLGDADLSYATLGSYATRHEISIDGPLREYYLHLAGHKPDLALEPIEQKGGIVKVTLVKSTTGFDRKQLTTVTSLGLRRIRHTVELKDTPAVRGMIHKVRHLVTVE
jgi:ribosomal protein L30